MTHILAFLQRLFSPIGQANVKAAWAELAVLGGCIGILISAYKSKDWTTIFQQGADFYTALIILIADIRNIFSSNEKAIANPGNTKVTGTINS